MRTARLGLLALLVLSACAGPRLPPPLRPSPALAPPLIPELPPLTDPALLGLAKVADPLSLLRYLGVNPAMLPGFRAEDVHPGPAAVFLFAPRPGAGELPSFVAQLPVRSDSGTVEALRRMSPASTVAPIGPDTRIHQNAESAERANGARQDLQALVQAPSRDDLQLLLNMPAIMERYGPGLRRSIALIDEQTSKAGRGPGLGRIYQPFLAALEELSELAIGARLEPSALLVSLELRDRAPAPAGAEGVSAELVTFLPAAPVRLQMNGHLWKKWLRWSVALLGVLPPDFAAARAELGAAADGVQIAATFSFARMHGATILVGKQAGHFAELQSELIKLLGTPSSLEFFRKQDLACTSKALPRVRMIEGFPVDRYEHDCKSTLALPDLGARMMTQIYPMVFELVRMGEEFVYVSNAPDGELEQIVRARLAGKPIGPRLAAVEAFPDRELLHADIDGAALVNGIGDLLAGASSPAPLPKLDPSIPPLVMAAAEGGDRSYYRARIPNAFIAAMGKLISQVKAAFAQPAPKP